MDGLEESCLIIEVADVMDALAGYIGLVSGVKSHGNALNLGVKRW